MTDTTTYIGLLQALVADPPQSADAVRDRLGITLVPVSKDRKLRDEGAGTTDQGLVIEEVSLSYLPDGDPGTLAVTLPHDAAPMVGDVIDVFARLKMTEVPRGQSLQEETVLSRAETWGTFSLGIAETDRNRLRSVYFKFHTRD